MPDPHYDQDQDARTITAIIRDVPASCTCLWEFIPAELTLIRARADTDCPWHHHRKESSP